MSRNLKSEFDDYFQVNDAIEVNLIAVKDEEVPESKDALELSIPPLFKLANEVNELDVSALRPLRNLGDVAIELAEYLKAQSRKIDLIMSHILASEQPDEHNQYCDSYGGGGLKISCETPFPINQNLKTKIFLKHEACAIYCFTQVIDVEHLEPNKYQHKLAFLQIRDEDKEIMVRASLHAQTRQLKKNQTK